MQPVLVLQVSNFTLLIHNFCLDLPDFSKPKKQTTEEEEDKKNPNKRKGILERENVFRKPYEKEDMME